MPMRLSPLFSPYILFAIVGGALIAPVLTLLGVVEPKATHAAVAASPTPVPVVTATAQRRDVPVYATGLGTVEASLTIGIHAQVDGIMQDVLFTEGANVHEGDVLAH